MASMTRKLLWLFCAMLVSGGAWSSGGSVTVVYFIPFEIETYLPVTKDAIECSAHEVWVVAGTEQQVQLQRFLENGEAAAFDEKRVRAKIVSPFGNAFIDATGVAQTASSSLRVDRGKFKALIVQGGLRNESNPRRGC